MQRKGPLHQRRKQLSEMVFILRNHTLVVRTFMEVSDKEQHPQKHAEAKSRTGDRAGEWGKRTTPLA